MLARAAPALFNIVLTVGPIPAWNTSAVVLADHCHFHVEGFAEQATISAASTIQARVGDTFIRIMALLP